MKILLGRAQSFFDDVAPNFEIAFVLAEPGSSSNHE
jgi:hypothetical protein